MEEKIKKVASDLENCKAEVGDHIALLRGDITKIQADIAEILGIFRSSKGFFRVVGWIGRLVIWGSIVAGGLVALWHLLSTGEWHK